MITTTVLALLSPAVAIMIAAWSFRRSRNADRLRAFFELHERYLADDARLGRRVIYDHIVGREPQDVQLIDAGDLRRAGYALAIMNSIAIAVEGRYVDEALIRRSMGQSYRNAVTAAKPYIDHLESRRGYRPYPFAEKLAAALSVGGPDHRDSS